VAVILAALIWMATLSGATSLWTVGGMFFILGAGLGLIMVRAGITSPETLVPSPVKAAGEPLRTAIIDAYANSPAPVFWYLMPILAVALVLALFLPDQADNLVEHHL
jgi:hypothetical protein